MPKQNKSKRHGTRTQKCKKLKPTLTGGAGDVSWFEFFSGKRSTQRHSSGNSRRHSRKRTSSHRR